MRIKQILIAILSIGLVVSLLLTVLVFQYEIDSVKSDFTDHITKTTKDIKESLQDVVVANDKLSFLFQVSDEVSDEDFLVHSRALISQIPFVKKIVYAPKVRRTHIEAEEKILQLAGYTGFKFRSFLPPQTVESRLSDVIFPIELIQPFNPYTSVWFGRDLMTFLPAQNVLYGVISGAKKMQVVWSKASDKKEGTEYYLFSSLTFLDYLSDIRSEKTEDIFGLLAYEIDLPALLSDAITNQNIITRISLNNHQLFSKGAFSDNALININSTDTIEFEGQNLTLQYQLLDPLKRVDYRILSLVIIASLLFTALVYLIVKAHLERHKLLNDQNLLIENKVAEKTRLLEMQAKQINIAYDHQLAVSRELEAFSYSISHDLRAPLRSISGFANALHEDYGQQLNEDGKDMLLRVQNGAEKMSMLIDALLSLSKVSRQRFSHQKFSISDLANEKVHEFREQHPDSRVKVNIMENLDVEGDRNLIYIVLDNLLGNAFKYSSKSENSLVEFGAIDQDGKSVFFVRDNGIGFDITFANKLFIAFQRLHGEEFEGTGIGLATVQRIINRHGGKIWAESELGKGATFYFTIG